MTLALVVYFAALSVLAAFGLHRLVLVRHARRPAPAAPLGPVSGSVLVQLPLYNEALVAEGLVRAVARMRGPVAEIQILDDSSDETSAVLNRVVAELADPRIRILRRAERRGYKAGALAHGLERSEQPFVAIFDADFRPEPDFLERVLPSFADPRCGMVQARWGHENREESWLTRAQALFLDGHFGIEHRARARAGFSFNFNGTAGVWRRRAIDEAGGWRDDTITEDLDLSYRAQLAGWRFAYLDEVLVPAELTESWMAFRAQQSRWVKGSMETARRLLGPILRGPWGPRRKLEAVLHITGNAGYLLMALIGALLPITVVLRDRAGWSVPGGQLGLSLLDFSMLSAGTMAMCAFYAVTVRGGPDRRARLADIPFALCLGAGMSLSNGVQVVAGLFSRRSEFVRTPKRGDASAARLGRTYRSPPGVWLALLELLFAAYFGAAIAYAVFAALWGAIPFLLLYLVGFAAVGGGVMREAWARPRAAVYVPLEVTSSRRGEPLR